jgi:hypothetical protein
MRVFSGIPSRYTHGEGCFSFSSKEPGTTSERNAKLPQTVLAEQRGLTHSQNLHDLRATSRAPRANNRMNAGTARALYVQGSSRRIGFTLVSLLGRFVFDHHDGVHDEVTIRIEFFIERSWPGRKRSVLRLRIRRGSRIEVPQLWQANG